MKTHDQLVKALMERPGVKTEVDRLEREETALLDTLPKPQHETGSTQPDQINASASRACLSRD